MERLEQDISYLVGRYLGVARKIELELDRLARKESPSLVEEQFEHFVDEPAKYMAICQEQVVRSLLLLKSLGRPELVEDMGQIFRLININSLEHITLRADTLIHGFHKQLASYDQK
ncbi:MAG: hypothetical protein R3Y63_05600 [Eubacteriales bacterium]